MSGGTTLNILVTGGTGSLGTALVPALVAEGHFVTVLSRDPHKQNALRKIAPEANFVLGDVCNARLVDDLVATGMFDAVIHAAALKHVDAGEVNVDEYTRVNVLGSQTVVNACKRFYVPNAILISSDKAVDPINLYGKTKAIAEDVFVSAGFNALRYGNVVSSRGSFLNVWEDAAKRGDKITVRTPNPTRFFLKLSGAVDLVIEAMNGLDETTISNGSVLVPRALEAFSIYDAADLFFDSEDINGVPLLPGEKQNEVLVSTHEIIVSEHYLLCEISKGSGMLNPQYNSGTCNQIGLARLVIEFKDLVGPTLRKRMEEKWNI